MCTLRKDWTKLLLDSIAPIAEEFSKSAEAAAADFAAVEVATGVALGKIRRLLVDTGLCAATAASPVFHCPDCACQLSPWQVRERTVETAQGAGTYPAIRYRCAKCRTDHYPIELANGLDGDRFTTGAKAVVARAAADLAYAHVSSSLLEWRSIHVSPKEVDRTAREVSEWRQIEEEELIVAVCDERAEPVHDLYSNEGWTESTPAILSVDGVMVRSPEMGPKGLIWFECRGGMIGPADDNTAARKSFIGGHLTPDGIFERLEAAWRTVENADRQVLFIADGGDWIWNRVFRRFPNAIQVIDVYHAGKHVARAAKAVWGEHSATAKLWEMRGREMLIAEGGPRAVLRQIVRGLRTGRAVNAGEARTAFRYLYTHRHRMPYAELQAKGLAIASGAMESAVKQACVSRMRQPGMKWTRDGAHSMLDLRCASLSGTLTDTTDRKHQLLQGKLLAYSAQIEVAA